MKPESYPILIFLAPFLATFIIPLFRSERFVSQLITFIALSISLYFSISGFIYVMEHGSIHYKHGGWSPPFGIEWRLDSLSALMCVLVSSISLIVIISSGPSVDREIGRSKIPYFMIVLLHLSSLMGIILTNDFFNLFVFIEVASLTGYALIASGDDKRGNVSSFKYLLLGTLGASFYLLGVGYLYATTGTLNMSDMAVRLPAVLSSKSVFMGILLIFLGLAMKMGLFPFHGWLPDAYTHASNSATALIAPLMTKVMIYSFIRIFVDVFGLTTLTLFKISEILLILGSLAVIIGSFLAFNQKSFKRMLAYSSISHIGLIMLALSMANQSAYIGAILHIVNHAIMKTILFLIAAAAAHTHGIHNLLEFSKARGRMPYSMAALVIAGLSMIGIPPLAGFFSKWYILLGAIQTENYLIVALILFSGLLTALYFFKIIEKIYFQKPRVIPKIAEAPAPLVFWPGLLSIGLIFMGFCAPAFYKWGLKYLIPMVT